MIKETSLHANLISTLENKSIIIKNGCKVSKNNWIMQEVRRKLRIRLIA